MTVSSTATKGMPTDGDDPKKHIVNFWFREKRWWGYTHF